MLGMSSQPHTGGSSNAREAKGKQAVARKAGRSVIEDPDVGKPKPAERKKSRSLKGKTGRLSELMNVPNDVFYEIVSWLKPLDLLHLARASKYLRSLLMSKDNAFLWKSARKNVPGMPDCPAVLAEPRYAAAVFDKHCFACGKPRSNCTDFSLTLRFYGPCFKANIRRGNSLDPDITKTDWSLFVAVPKALHPHKDPTENGPRHSYYCVEFNAVRDQLNHLSRDSSGLQKFIEDRREFTRQMQEHGLAVSLWNREGLNKRYEDEEEAKSDRKKAINEKLSELGYSEDDYPHISNSDWTRIVDQGTRLSDRIWKKIRPKLEELLEQEKNDRIDAAFNVKLTKRLEEIRVLYAAFVDRTFAEGDRSFLPNLFDVRFLPSVVDLALTDDAQNEITEDQFAAIRDLFLVDLQEYAERVQRDLYNLLVESQRLPDDESHVPELDPAQIAAEVTSASALFICENCEPGTFYTNSRSSKTLSGAGICAHWREEHPLAKWPAAGEPAKSLTGMAYLLSLCQPQKNRRLLVRPKKVQDVARDALSALGLPGDTGYAHMNELVRTGRLVCLCGDPDLLAQREPSWAVLVGHVCLQRQWYSKMSEDLEESDNRDELREQLLDDHSLTDKTCCLKILVEGEEAAYPDRTVPPGVADEINSFNGVRTVLCRICSKMRGKNHKNGYISTTTYLNDDLTGIAHHMITKHGKVLQTDNIVVEVWW